MKKTIKILTIALISSAFMPSVYCQTGNTAYGGSAGNGALGGRNSSFGGWAGDVATGYDGSYFGYYAGKNNTSGSENSFFGSYAGVNNTTGSNNSIFGFNAGYHASTGNDNAYFGYNAAFNGGGNRNSVFGTSGAANLSGSDNTIIGYSAGANAGSAAFNTYVGTRSGRFATGSFNVFIGHEAGYSAGGDSYKLYIDVANTSTPLIYGDFNSNYLIANGKVGIETGSAPTHRLQVLNAYCDGNTWYNSSDKNLKENFARINLEESILGKVMQLPIQYWNYIGDNSSRHIGPTAQDFYKIFKVGSNEKAISTVDQSGIALAAIQELNNKTDALIRTLKEQQEVISALLQAKSIEHPLIDETGVRLHQNHPNPFQVDTEIKMEIPDAISMATLYIYDFHGKTVEKRLISGRGLTSVIIAAGRFSPGIYLYTIIVDGHAAEIKKMILTDQ
jgi:hypothetical protein